MSSSVEVEVAICPSFKMMIVIIICLIFKLIFEQVMFFQQVTEYPKTSCKEKTFPQEKKNIKTLDWNANGQYLATGDTNIRLWQFDGNNIKRHTDLKQSEQLECLLFHPINPDYLAAITRTYVRIWDCKTKTEVRQEKREFVGPATWHPSGNTLACISKLNKDSQISFLDMNGQNDTHILYQNAKEKLEKHLTFEMKCIQYDPLGDIFVVGGAQNNVGVFQVMSAAKPELPPFEIIDAHQALVTCIVFSKLGNYMATGGADSLILLWKLPELLSVASFMSVESEIRSMSFSFDEKWFSVVASEEMLHVFSVEKGLTGLTDSVDTVKCEGKSPQCVVYHPQKQTLAFVCQDSKDSVIHLYSS